MFKNVVMGAVLNARVNAGDLDDKSYVDSGSLCGVSTRLVKRRRFFKG